MVNFNIYVNFNSSGTKNINIAKAQKLNAYYNKEIKKILDNFRKTQANNKELK